MKPEEEEKEEPGGAKDPQRKEQSFSFSRSKMAGCTLYEPKVYKKINPRFVQFTTGDPGNATPFPVRLPGIRLGGREASLLARSRHVL